MEREFSSAGARATRFAGRGSDGEDDTGSKAGKRVGVDSAGRLTPATGGISTNAFREGEFMMSERLLVQTSSQVNDTEG